MVDEFLIRDILLVSVGAAFGVLGQLLLSHHARQVKRRNVACSVQSEVSRIAKEIEDHMPVHYESIRLVESIPATEGHPNPVFAGKGHFINTPCVEIGDTDLPTESYLSILADLSLLGSDLARRVSTFYDNVSIAHNLKNMNRREHSEYTSMFKSSSGRRPTDIEIQYLQVTSRSSVLHLRQYIAQLERILDDAITLQTELSKAL